MLDAQLPVGHARTCWACQTQNMMGHSQFVEGLAEKKKGYERGSKVARRREQAPNEQRTHQVDEIVEGGGASTPSRAQASPGWLQRARHSPAAAAAWSCTGC
jgi:hypothetical protein